MNEETAAKMAEAELSPSPAPVTVPAPGPHPDIVHECCWDNCDWQFEDMADCIEHAVAEEMCIRDRLSTDVIEFFFYIIYFYSCT